VLDSLAVAISASVVVLVVAADDVLFLRAAVEYGAFLRIREEQPFSNRAFPPPGTIIASLFVKALSLSWVDVAVPPSSSSKLAIAANAGFDSKFFGSPSMNSGHDISSFPSFCSQTWFSSGSSVCGTPSMVRIISTSNAARRLLAAQPATYLLGCSTENKQAWLYWTVFISFFKACIQ